MAAPGKSMRWGSFLSQAVAGVESRLDNMLGDSPEEGQGSSTTMTTSPQQNTAVNPGSSSSRASSANRTNERLQARLAKAIAAKNASVSADSKTLSFPPSSSDSDNRGSRDSASTGASIVQAYKPENTPAQPALKSTDTHSTLDKPHSIVSEIESDPIDHSQLDASEELISVKGPAQEDTIQLKTGEHTREEPEVQDIAGNKIDASELARELLEIKQRHQEEIQEYVERTDSLQSKLQYLSKNAADAAKQTVASATSSSLEKKIAERDERIALLMEEGQKLANSEHKYRITIKKMRSQLSENDKQLAELQKSRDKALADTNSLRNLLTGNEEKDKRQQETMKAIAALQKEIDALKIDKFNGDETVRRLELEIKSKVEEGEAAKADALSKILATEREKQQELGNANAALKADLQASYEKNLLNTTEWTEKLARQTERSQSAEDDLRAEIRSMETKLENMRATAEEATSSTGGEAQLKLLRQIETLQSQYASARDNWQGIEASLQAKTAGLEKEGDEAQRRESEMRKKARDSATRLRTLEEELQDAKRALVAAQQELEVCREQLVSLQTTSKATETALEQARADLVKERRAPSRDFSGEAGQSWAEELAGTTSINHSRPESPLLSVSRTFSSDVVGLHLPNRSRRTPTPGSVPEAGAEGPGNSRRSPFHLPTRVGTTSATGSNPPMPFSPFELPIETPSSHPPFITERENGVGDAASSSPRQLAQDMISVSTVAAGPTVQLVERMSAAIRRLESEKVVAKEEMIRVCSQRDEARGDMVSLMKELEEAKTAGARIPELEKEVADLDARYQTTLELLGEKSELVEELRADVDDVKAMYRELVERTIK